jgi:hypothetical protein
VQRALGALSSLPDDYTPQQAYAAIENCLALLYPQAGIGEDQKSFWKDVAFSEAYRMLAGDNYRALERKYTVFNLVTSLYWVPGDMAECGAYNGGTAYFMALAAERSGRSCSMRLFDSFEGLPEPRAEDAATGACLRPCLLRGCGAPQPRGLSPRRVLPWLDSVTLPRCGRPPIPLCSR